MRVKYGSLNCLSGSAAAWHPVRVGLLKDKLVFNVWLRSSSRAIGQAFGTIVFFFFFPKSDNEITALRGINNSFIFLSLI